ncbi:MAG: carboxypeptidase regulatory-like domain-containing protein [Acidobacteria bacterium]|nr:carboxypeptidase regulatory-like domain-containing protein [Acidobacteriota bacterium]
MSRFTGILLASWMLAVPAWSQTAVAQLLGTVRDPQGAAIQNAAVTVVNEGTNDTRKTVADAQGSFVFPQLPVGRYTLTVESPGFQKYVLQGIALKVDDRRREDVALRVGEVTQEITVAASAIAVNSTNATIGEVITAKPIIDLPLNGRNFLQLAQLTPGTVPPVLQNGEDTTSSFNGRRTNLSVGISGTRQVSGPTCSTACSGAKSSTGPSPSSPCSKASPSSRSCAATLPRNSAPRPS